MMMAELSDLILQFVGGFEWIIIVIIIVLLIFGVKKIPELAKSVGKASSEYEKAKIEAQREIERIRTGKENTSTISRKKLESIAETLGIDYINKSDIELKHAIDTEINKKL
jgi:sec-independent protein translocase protein TatA